MTEQPSADAYDVVVVGLGPGGEFSANKLARAGLRVLAVDKHLAGGECPFYGCNPSKTMIRAAHALAEGRRVGAVAGRAHVEPDLRPVMARVRREIVDDWSDERQVARLRESGADVVHAEARLLGSGRVEVGGRTVRAERGIVLATGTAPSAPPVDGLDRTPYWTNREVFTITRAPSSLAVIGAGAVGAELAQTFARFGTDVTLLEAADRVLAAEEPEVSAVVARALTRDGVDVRTGARIERVDHDGDAGFRLRLADGEVTADRLLVAAGRRRNLPGLGLEEVGADPEQLEVDGCLRVLDRDGRPVDKVFAVGDITGKGAYTHTAKYQAAIVVRGLLAKAGPEADYRAVPRVTFTDPEVGHVGLTETQAREQGREVRVGRADVASSSRGLFHGVGADGLVKLVAEGDLLVGGTAVGPAGGEVLSMLTLAVHARVPIDQLRSMIYAYPTWHGAVRTALADLG